MQPSQDKIDFIKAQFPDRVVHKVVAVNVDKDTGEEQVAVFLMTGPTRDEYKMFTKKMIAAKEDKDEDDRMWAIRTAIENAALAQIRWPDRPEVQAIFNKWPEMIDNFSHELQKAAGTNIELRSSKL